MAQNLRQDDIVFESFQDSKTQVRIAHLQLHSKKHANVVELTTGQGSIKVSATHRVEVAGASEEFDTTLLARDLLEGVHKVMVGRRPQLLTKVRPFTEKTELVEIGFDPDVPVEAFIAPAWGIQTRGVQMNEELPSQIGNQLMQLLPQVSEEDLIRAMPTEYED